MNQTQKKYAIERIDAIENDKLNKLKEKYTRKGKLLSYRERLRLIRNGKVSMKSEKELDQIEYSLNDISAVFVFSKYEWAKTIDIKLYKPEAAKLIKKAKGIRDKLMLGNSEEALKMIQEFENLKE